MEILSNTVGIARAIQACQRVIAQDKTIFVSIIPLTVGQVAVSQ